MEQITNENTLLDKKADNKMDDSKYIIEDEIYEELNSSCFSLSFKILSDNYKNKS